jgi:hypothetical protein
VGDADRDSAYVDASGGDSLSRRECLDYLAMADLGHLALSQGALPVVVPVNLALVGEEVIVRTQPGSKLVAAALHAVVAVQAEGVAPDRRHAWSVLVQGVAREVTHPDQLAWLRREGPRPLVPHRGGHFIAIPTQLISGRRFPLRPEDDGRFHEL